jgi:hypothetical protein
MSVVDLVPTSTVDGRNASTRWPGMASPRHHVLGTLALALGLAACSSSGRTGASTGDDAATAMDGSAVSEDATLDRWSGGSSSTSSGGAASSGGSGGADAATTTDSSGSSGGTGTSSGGSSGSSSSTDASSSDAGCTAGAVRCYGLQPQSCVTGIWANTGTACASACVGPGLCTACSPGQTGSFCSGATYQRCDSTGTWQTVSCPASTPFCTAPGTCVQCISGSDCQPAVPSTCPGGWCCRSNGTCGGCGRGSC